MTYFIYLSDDFIVQFSTMEPKEYLAEIDNAKLLEESMALFQKIVDATLLQLNYQADLLKVAFGSKNLKDN